MNQVFDWFVSCAVPWGMNDHFLPHTTTFLNFTPLNTPVLSDFIRKRLCGYMTRYYRVTPWNYSLRGTKSSDEWQWRMSTSIVSPHIRWYNNYWVVPREFFFINFPRYLFWPRYTSYFSRETHLKVNLHWEKANGKENFYFDLCHCSMWTLNWILYEPIWKLCRFCTNIKRPLSFIYIRVKVKAASLQMGS